jgi:hypothetical protein
MSEPAAAPEKPLSDEVRTGVIGICLGVLLRLLREMDVTQERRREIARNMGEVLLREIER